MAEKVGSIYFDLDLDDTKFNSGMNTATQKTKSFGDHLQSSSLQLAALGAAATLALTKVVDMLGKTVDAAVAQQNALMGLSSIARAFGHDINGATRAAQELSADGLMPLGDAAAGLKNLLASGFSLPQAIKLMNAFKDSAAFGRQGSLEFGQAIVGATEGIKNGNSALVDNAGVTKNLSNILVDAGFSAQDLSKAGQDASVRMAIFNGVLKETSANTGDAAKLSDSFGGAAARNATQIRLLQVAIGEALIPVIGQILTKLAPVIDKFIEFAKQNPKIVAAWAAIAVVALSLVAVLGLVGALVGAIMSMGVVGGILAAIVGGVSLLAGAFVFLQEKYDIVQRATDLWRTSLETLQQWINDTKNAIIDFKDQAIAKAKDIIDDFRDAIDAAKKKIMEYKDEIKNTAIVLGVIFGPALLKVGVQAAIVAGQMVASAAVAAAAWVKATAKAALAASINFAKMTAAAIAHGVVSGVQAVIAGGKWVAQAALAGAAWVLRFALMGIGAVALGLLMAAQAAIAGWAWMLGGIQAGAAWLLQFGLMAARAVITGLAMAAAALAPMVAWIASAVAVGIAWLIAMWPVLAVIAAVGAAVFLVIKYWEPIKGFFAGLWQGIVDIINGVINWLKGNWPLVLAIITGPIGLAAYFIARNFDAIKGFITNAFGTAVGFVRGKIDGMIGWFRDIGGRISGALGNVKDAIMRPFREALDSVKGWVDGAVNKLKDLNPFKRHSPSLVDWITRGTNRITDLYGHMYRDLNAMSIANTGQLTGTMSAMAGAAGANEASGGAIASPPMNITVAPQGIVARSRSEFRDIIADGIEAVNEDLIARGIQPIGNGKVNGSSSV